MLVRTTNVLVPLLITVLVQFASNSAEDMSTLLEDIMNSLAVTGYGGQTYGDQMDPYVGQQQQQQQQQQLYATTGMEQFGKSGYAQPMSYSPAPSYEPTPVYAPESQYPPAPVYAPAPVYSPAPSYEAPPSYYPEPSYGYSPEPSYHQQQPSYGYKPKPIIKVKKVYIPVAVKKKKKKMKIISVQKGFFIPGGTQLFGKYKSLKACEKACAATPNCFAGDYNPWFKKCYVHSNYTACGTINAHKKLIHFKKIPCSFPEAPKGRVMLGVQIFKGIEQKGIKSLSDCLKKCAAAGMGIPAKSMQLSKQICFGIDYDFGTHKCYFHVNNMYPPQNFCPYDGSPPKVPRDTVPNPSVVSILMCPGV